MNKCKSLNTVAMPYDIAKRLEYAGTAYGSMGYTAPKCVICKGLAPGRNLFIGNGNYHKGEGHNDGCELGAIMSRVGSIE